MSKYLKKFETTAAYEAAKDGLILPNVSICVDTPNEVHYNSYTPPIIAITYTATEKLVETESRYSWDSGLHVNSFSGSTGQLTITNHTFENGVGTIQFNDNVTSIGNYAFINCSGLTSIVIPDGVTSIGVGAFSGCSGLPTENNLRYADTYLVEATSKSNTSYTIKDGTKFIGSSAFKNCSGMTSVAIPDSVISIGQYAFQGCSGMTSIVIPNSVINIDSNAFLGCRRLTSCTIGSGVTSIGNCAFQYCAELSSITCNATTAPTIRNDTFFEVKQNGTLYVPQGSSGYDVWMDTGNYYLGKYNWTKVEQ